MSIDDSGLWGTVVIVGPIVLALAIAWAMLRNRGATRHEIERTEAATKAMYDEQNRDDAARDKQ